MNHAERNALALWFESEMAEMADPAKSKAVKQRNKTPSPPKRSDTFRPSWIQAIVCTAVAAIGFVFWYGQLTSDIGHLQKDITRIDGRLDNIQSQLLSLRAERAGSNPHDPLSQSDAKRLIVEARKTSIRLPDAVIEQTGKRFIDASKDDPMAWSVALDLISYRSSFNLPQYPNGAVVESTEDMVTHYKYNPVPSKSHPRVKWVNPLVPAAQATRWQRIGVDENQTIKAQPSWLLAIGGATSLDGEYIRHVVFQDVEIHYSGKPVVLDEVIFINCVFVFDNDDRSRQLGEQLLASSSVTFRGLG